MINLLLSTSFDVILSENILLGDTCTNTEWLSNEGAVSLVYVFEKSFTTTKRSYKYCEIDCTKDQCSVKRDFKSINTKEHKENAPRNQFELNMKDSKFEFNIPSTKAGKVEWIEELNDAERFREKTVSGIDKEIVELRQLNKMRKIPDGPRLITVNEYSDDQCN